MRDVGGEAAGAFLGLAQLAYGLLQLARRRVEGPCQVGQFVAAAHRNPGVESAAAHVQGSLAQFAHRAQHAARGDQAGYQRDGEAWQGAVPACHEEGVDVDLLVGHPHDGVQDESAGQLAVRARLEDHGHGDGQVGDAVLDDPLEAAVRVGPCGAAQLGGDDGGDGVLARGGADRTVFGEHHPGVGLALAGDATQEFIQVVPSQHGQREGRRLDVFTERRDRRVLGGLQHRVAGLAVGERGRRAGADGGDQQEGEHQPRTQPERPDPRPLTAAHRGPKR